MEAILAVHEGAPAASRCGGRSAVRKGVAPIVFVGEYDRSVDGNGRLALPADFRELLGDRCYVTCDPEGFVRVTSQANFESEAGHLKELVRAGVRPMSALRSFGVQSFVASIDKQGRITLDESSRRHAGLASGGQAIIAGAIDNLEIWRPSRYRQVRGEDGVIQPSRIWQDEDGP